MGKRTMILVMAILGSVLLTFLAACLYAASLAGRASRSEVSQASDDALATEAYGRDPEQPLPVGQWASSLGEALAVYSSRLDDYYDSQFYLVVDARYCCAEGSGTCTIRSDALRVFGKGGKLSSADPFPLIHGSFLDRSQEVMPGHCIDVSVPFNIDEGDKDFVLVWDSGFGQEASYLDVGN